MSRFHVAGDFHARYRGVFFHLSIDIPEQRDCQRSEEDLKKTIEITKLVKVYGYFASLPVDLLHVQFDALPEDIYKFSNRMVCNFRR